MSFACLLSVSGLDEHDRLDRSDLSALPRNLRALASGLDHRSMPCCNLLHLLWSPLDSFGAYMCLFYFCSTCRRVSCVASATSLSSLTQVLLSGMVLRRGSWLLLISSKQSSIAKGPTPLQFYQFALASSNTKWPIAPIAEGTIHLCFDMSQMQLGWPNRS